MKVVKHTKYDMYYVEWPDGVRSEDFYNLTRAKEFCIVIPERERESKLPIAQRAGRGPVERFK